MTTEPYIPIDCDQHSILEVLAMRHTRVSAQALDDAGSMIGLEGAVRDVVTRAGAEYLVLRDASGVDHAIRLDRLVRLSDPAGAPLWRQKTVPG